MLHAVVTTIQEPTPCMAEWSAVLAELGAPLVVMGDKKGPPRFELPQARFYALEHQARCGFALAGILPTGHYARKNLGYLVAMREGAECIFETDDDNAPLPGWRARSLVTDARNVTADKWFNAFREFSDGLIWPRGYPLGRVREPQAGGNQPVTEVTAPIQQGLANASPDVDALWRLILDREFHFSDGPSVHLPRGVWCPFNSQCTWWWPSAYVLMYLPSTCTFRMTDIWRSFIAQRCLWELGHGVVFHGPEVVQERNEHDLMRDFEDEVPGYLGNERMTDLLTALRLQPGEDAIGSNLISCYELLTAEGFFEPSELELVRAWVEDVDSST